MDSMNSMILKMMDLDRLKVQRGIHKLEKLKIWLPKDELCLVDNQSNQIRKSKNQNPDKIKELRHLFHSREQD
jgi:hypothetical protein